MERLHRGVELLSAKMPGPAGYLRDELIRNLFLAKEGMILWQDSLVRVKEKGDWENVPYYRSQILKYMAIEVQALAGLAALQAGETKKP